MDVFISWSGTLSHNVAVELKRWLNDVIQILRPYVSSEDIDKGSRWFNEVSAKLDSCDIGIVCLTRENLHSDWLLFEAGALSKKLTKGKVCTLLIDLSPVEVASPLSEFQSTSISEDDMRKLITTLNKALPTESALSESRLENQFKRCWADFETAVRRVVEEAKNTGLKTDSVVANLLIPIMYREIDNCNISEIFEWFQEYKNSETFYNHPEIKLTEAVLSRMCGKRTAFSLLENYPKSNNIAYHQIKYELALLKYAKPYSLAAVELDVDLTENMDSGLLKLWAGLLGIWNLREGNYAKVEHYFEVAKAANIKEDPMETYGSVQLGIIAAALGKAELAERYLDIARKINTNIVYSTNGYPFLSLIEHHERAFVAALLGKGDSGIDLEWIKELRGHSHVVASYAHTLRLCEPALDSLVDLSKNWSKPLQKEMIKQRLGQFEKSILEKAGTLFVGV